VGQGRSVRSDHLRLLAATSLAAFLGGRPLLSGKHLGTSLSDPGVLRAVLGAAGFASPEAVRTLT
jgi:hypothetical protein